MKKNRKIKILWEDTKIFSPKNKTLAPTLMETIGFLEKKYNEYYLIRKPVTINLRTKEGHPNKNPSFYLIPKSMVLSIKKIDYYTNTTKTAGG